MALNRTQRHFKIINLLAENVITSQVQLMEILNEIGAEVTQATVSRDLEELGAIKIRTKDNVSAYAIPENIASPVVSNDHLSRVLGDWVGEVKVSNNLVVLKTPPGSAHVVASALDRSVIENIVGTVAGDDTVLVIADEKYGGRKLASDLARLSQVELS